jgi:beta-lactamase class A
MNHLYHKLGGYSISYASINIGPDGKLWEHHGDRKFLAASTIKIPIMIEVYRQIERGLLSSGDTHVLRGQDRAQGSGVLLHLHDGLQLTIDDLLYLMIAISDNTAMNILIRRMGFEAVNTLMRELGMSRSSLGREAKGRAAEVGEQENWATANDFARAVQAIVDGKAASRKACEMMMGLLGKQQNKRRIVRFLPEGDHIRWGTKTGSLTGITNDVGFVINKDRVLILAVYCEGTDQHAAELGIGKISRAAMAVTNVVEPQPDDSIV